MWFEHIRKLKYCSAKHILNIYFSNQNLWFRLFARFFICLQLCFILLLETDHINIIHNTIYDDIFPKELSLCTFIVCIRSANDGSLFIMHFTVLCSDFAFLKNGCFNSFLADGLFVGSFIRQVAIMLLKDYKTSREINQYCHNN